MANPKYSYSVDVENPTTSHSQAVLLVTPGSTVLDIGAADGSVARSLVARGCRVWAVERDPAAAATARDVCERVIVGDVEEIDLEAELGGQAFDYVLYLDVLEHLRDPLAVLKRARDYLRSGGRVIASIPNVTHGAVRLSLMSGAFRYTETGLLDSTHLRFFDRPGAERLFADAGLRIVERLRVTRGLTETEIPVDLEAVSPAVLEQLHNDDDATTYQFIFLGVPADSADVTAAGASLAEALQRRLDETEAKHRELETYARSLEQQGRDLREQVESITSRASLVDTDLRGLRTELERRMEELALKSVELRHLQADLVVKEAFIAELRQAIASSEAVIAGLRQTNPPIGKDEELARTREALERLQIYVNSPGFRMVASAARTLSRYPRTYRFLQRGVRRVGGAKKA